MSDDTDDTSHPGDEAPRREEQQAIAAEEIQKADQLRGQLLRLAAEFDNWKKRTEKELAEAETRGRADVLVELPPVLDNVERALAQIGRDDPIAKGVQLVYRQLLGIAEKLGLRRFDPIGERFDPRMHQALAQMETVEMPAGTVAQVHAPGYLHQQKLLRPALVTVSTRPRETET